MVGTSTAGRLVSGHAGRRTPSHGGDGVLPCPAARRARGRFRHGRCRRRGPRPGLLPARSPLLPAGCPHCCADRGVMLGVAWPNARTQAPSRQSGGSSGRSRCSNSRNRDRAYPAPGPRRSGTSEQERYPDCRAGRHVGGMRKAATRRRRRRSALRSCSRERGRRGERGMAPLEPRRCLRFRIAWHRPSQNARVHGAR